MKGNRSSRLQALPLAVGCVLSACVLVLACACAGASQSVVGKVAAAVDVACATTGAQGPQSNLGGQKSSLDAGNLLSVAGSSGIVLFNAKDNSGTTPDYAALADVRAAVKDIEESGQCGFVFLDAVTGRGLAYNAAEPLYIASAAKAPVSFYALQNGAGENEAERDGIEGAILYSDNDSYESFAYNYTDTAYSRWLVAHDIDHDNYSYDLYPPMSARTLACIWLEILQYVQAGSADAQWFADLLASTDTSFIRDATPGNALVMNKGGWINEGSEWVGGYDEDGEAYRSDLYYASVSDAGIIACDGKTYVMAIVTDQPDEGATEANVVALARALFDARDIL